MSKRAQQGGEYGANGAWYTGGRFLNTIAENPKGSPHAKQRTSKQEYEPNKWDVAPAGQRSLYKTVESGCTLTSTGFLQPIEAYLTYISEYPDTKARFLARIKQYNSGIRWI